MKIPARVKKNLRRLTDAEYAALWKELPPRGSRRKGMKLGNVPDEEYKKMLKERGLGKEDV